MTKNAAFLGLIFVVLIGYYGYLLSNQKIPCETPISYNLAYMDEKFDLTEAQAKPLIRRAAKLWNDALGKEVFVEAEDPEMPIYFVYGRVQRAVDTIDALANDIEAAKDEATKIANEYDDLRKKYEALNRRGQATEEMYNELISLQAQYYELRDRINADVAKSRGAIPEGELEEGKYTLDEEGSRIYIYGYQSETGLLRVLMHEFGHALGLEHVANKNSIMYPSNAGTNLSLTGEDRTELALACAR